jgi:flagellar protein FliS
MNAISAITAYNKVGVESSVTAADPHKLISMLYQGAAIAIANAKNGILRKDIPTKGAAISKAIAIIDGGLNACLDKSVGGELARNLSSLYEYMAMRLLTANLKNDMTILDEVAHLLGELSEAWEGIRPGAHKTSVAQVARADEFLPTTHPEEIPNATVPQSAIGKQASLMYGRM